jgi:hypothetical protein
MTLAEDERLEASIWYWTADLLERSGLDAEAGSGEILSADGGLSFSPAPRADARSRLSPVSRTAATWGRPLSGRLGLPIVPTNVAADGG